MADTIPFDATTVVSNIDTDSDWFTDGLAERVALPGAKRIEHDRNVMTPAQVGVVVRGLQRDENTKDLSLADACDVARGPRMARLRGRQLDFDVVAYFARQEQEANSDLPLTTGQDDMVTVYIQALVGINPHWNAKVQSAIEALPQNRKDDYIARLDSATTQGELALVMKSLERFVPNPATVRASEQSAAAAATSTLDISSEGEEPF